jgi:hypothetical protein
VNECFSVDILLFPVKRLGLALLLACCGYQPIHASSNGERLCVRAVEPKIADFRAVHAALNGARSELQRVGALDSGQAESCLVIELLSIAELPVGLHAERFDGREQPRARGTTVVVRGRGWIEQRNRSVSRDTGDMMRDSRAAASSSIVTDTERHRALAQSAAFDLGRAIAQRILGLPTPSR